MYQPNEISHTCNVCNDIQSLFRFHWSWDLSAGLQSFKTIKTFYTEILIIRKARESQPWAHQKNFSNVKTSIKIKAFTYNADKLT